MLSLQVSEARPHMGDAHVRLRIADCGFCALADQSHFLQRPGEYH